MDLNLDGDWNDAGEIVSFFVSAPGIALSNATNLAVGPDGVGLRLRHHERLHRAAAGPGRRRRRHVGRRGVALLQRRRQRVGRHDAVRARHHGLGRRRRLGRQLEHGTTGTDSRDPAGRPEPAPRRSGRRRGRRVRDVSRSAGRRASRSRRACSIGADGAVYYLENGTTGKGIYRLHDDVTPNGVCTDAGEVTAFYLPAAPAPTPDSAVLRHRERPERQLLGRRHGFRPHPAGQRPERRPDHHRRRTRGAAVRPARDAEHGLERRGRLERLAVCRRGRRHFRPHLQADRPRPERQRDRAGRAADGLRRHARLGKPRQHPLARVPAQHDDHALRRTRS